MTIEEKIPLETIWRREKKLSSLIHSLTEAKLIHLHWFLALTNRRCVLSTLYTRFLKLWNQYQTYNFSASFKSCCPSCNFLSCRAAILVLFYFVTPLCAKDLVTGHLLGTRLCTLFFTNIFHSFIVLHFILLCCVEW